MSPDRCLAGRPGSRTAGRGRPGSPGGSHPVGVGRRPRAMATAVTAAARKPTGPNTAAQLCRPSETASGRSAMPGKWPTDRSVAAAKPNSSARASRSWSVAMSKAGVRNWSTGRSSCADSISQVRQPASSPGSMAAPARTRARPATASRPATRAVATDPFGGPASRCRSKLPVVRHTTRLQRTSPDSITAAPSIPWSVRCRTLSFGPIGVNGVSQAASAATTEASSSSASLRSTSGKRSMRPPVCSTAQGSRSHGSAGMGPWVSSGSARR